MLSVLRSAGLAVQGGGGYPCKIPAPDYTPSSLIFLLILCLHHTAGRKNRVFSCEEYTGGGVDKTGAGRA